MFKSKTVTFVLEMYRTAPKSLHVGWIVWVENDDGDDNSDDDDEDSDDCDNMFTSFML